MYKDNRREDELKKVAVTIEATAGKYNIIVDNPMLPKMKKNPFVTAYAEYLSDGLQVSNYGLDAKLLHKTYSTLLWKYGEAKAQKSYASDIKYPRRPKPNSIAPMQNNLSILSRSL
ncbi:hypothetical protein CQW23_01935 [Capsicum baccatum]|uniref:Uncharacterized protein n=1 Tax=Capsicum baccatum TaxID=33114 RepID=A0A2G2XPZ8_CAPBA|nr:hypothetical protein CQW23_01935 [Capsicum baccatum]